MHHYWLTVDRRDLRYGVELLRQARRSRLFHGDAILGYDGECLTLEAGDKMARAYATGSWPGNARTSASLVAALAKLSPEAGPVTIACDGQHVDFDKFLPLGVATADIQDLVDRRLEERFIGVSGKRNDVQ